MKVKIGNQSVFVRWQYADVPVERQGKVVGTTKQTTAIASIEGETVAEASVKKYHLDVEDKDEARKYSLSALLDKLYPIKKLQYQGEPNKDQLDELRRLLKAENAENKAARTLFWHAYMTRKNPDPEASLAAEAIVS